MMLTRVAWLLVAVWLLSIVFGWELLQRGVNTSYILSAVFLAASVGMGIYLGYKWQVLTKTERWGIILSLPIWLLLAYLFYR